MPPKKQLKRYTLKEAISYISGLANAPASRKNWMDALATLIHYVEAKDLAYPTTLKKSEMADKYADVNLIPIIYDIANVSEIIDTKIMSSRNDSPIAVDTRKQFYLAIIRLTQKKSPFQLSKEVKEFYQEKLKEIETLSNQQRNKNEAKRANLKYPDFTWVVAQKEFEDFIGTHSFTNTNSGRKDLRCAVIVGLYILQRPRRVADYSSLQYFSKKPAEKDLKDKNIIYGEGDKLFFSIDVFKTRYRVAGGASQKKELLPRYVKEVNPRLSSLIRDYIKKWNVKDMSKLTGEEKRQKKQYYVFYKETGTHQDAYDENSFSKYISSCMKKVFNNRSGLTVNTMRHNYNTWLSENLSMFNDAQLQEIAIDVGDTPRNLPTNLRYRLQTEGLGDVEKTQIEGIINDNEYARNVMLAGAEEEGSIGNAPDGENNQEADNEVISPAIDITTIANVPTDIDALYMKLGKAYMELETLKLMISRKLGLGA